MYLDLKTVPESLVSLMRKKVENNSLQNLISFRNFDKERDGESLLRIYNRAFLVNPDPFQRMEEKDLYDIEDRVIFMARYAGKDVGFIWLTPEIQDGKKIATISIIAVVPERQRRGIATAMALHAYEYLKENNINHLGCIVGEDNESIQRFTEFIGFKRFGRHTLEY